MRVFAFSVLFIMLALSSILPAQGYKYHSYYSILAQSGLDVDRIRSVEGILIVGRNDKNIFVAADDISASKVASLGYVITKSSQDEIFGAPLDGYYHTWSQVMSEIDSFTETYPNIAKCDTIGFSVQNRPIIRVKISDNPGQNELEGRIQFNGCHHGNEKISTEINLYFMRYLCENYGVLSEVTSLVDNREIYFVPVVNPDGFVLNQRYNANNIDLNRDYGYHWFNESGASNPFSEPESRTMRDDFISTGYSITLDYHSTASYVNYLWDYSPRIVPDYYEVVNMFSLPYADSTGYTPIKGYDWYQIAGSCQDATYGLFGILAVTIESQMPGDPDPECLKNRGAMKYVAKLAGYGIQGYVLDSVTGQPVEAVLFFQKGSDPKWPVNSSALSGDYQKILSPGTYSVTAHAPGHVSKTFSVQVLADTSIRQDFHLAPSDSRFGMRMMCARQEYSNFSNTTYTFDALGPADGIAMSMNRQGYAIIDFGENFPVTDVAGYDLKVCEANDGTADSCFVYVGNTPEYAGTWIYLGKISGTDSFDISATGLSQVRYVKIMDDGGSTSGAKPGYDLDAVQGINQPNSIEEPVYPVTPGNVSFSLTGGFFSDKELLISNLSTETIRVQISIADVSGRVVASDDITAGAGTTSYSIKNSTLGREMTGSNIYFLIVETDFISESYKILLFR
ncbi:DUF2817 domain-containing protein [candidate division WOR-3 bacterium]|nr:DUF2817 domain-containing protein [candidate division WOR-3 bacterium]